MMSKLKVNPYETVGLNKMKRYLLISIAIKA